MNPAVSRLIKISPVVAALAAGLALGNSALAAQKSVTWNDEACVHRISFDPAKHDEKRLKNTINLLFEPSSFEAPVPPFVGDPKAIAEIDLRKFDQQCSAALKTVREFELLPLNGIEDYRRAKIGETEDACRFGNVEIRGLRNPSALREYTRAPSCSHFIDALEGKSDMMKVFRETVTQQCSNNASPQRCRDDTLKNADKPDGKERVRLYLTMFGWNNCANKSTVRYDSKPLEQMRSGLEKQLRRMFAVRSKCENPG
jgi:hypothetical protein